MKRLVRLLAILAGTLLVVLVLVFLFARFYFTGDRILSVVRPQLEKNLNRTIEIQSAELSFFKGLGVRLEGVTLDNAPGFSRSFLLRLDELDVKVRFWPLLSGEVVLDRMLVGPGELRLEIDSLGHNNWSDLVKPDTTAPVQTVLDSVPTGFPTIPVAGKMEFSAITISLDDHRQGSLVELAGIDGQLTLALQADDLSVSASGRFRVGGGVVQTKTVRLNLAQVQPRLDFNLHASLPHRRLKLQKLKLEAFGIPLELSGKVENLGDLAQYTLGLKIEPVPLSRIFARLPDSMWRPAFPAGPPEGTIQADLTVLSPPSGQNYPLVEGKILLSGLRGQFGTKNIPFDVAGLDVRLAGTVVSLSAQSMTIAEIPLAVNLTVDQPHEPNFSGSVSGVIDVARLGQLAGQESPAEMGGHVEFAVSAFGAVKDWRNMSVNGKVDLDKVYWRTPDTSVFAIDDLSGSIHFTGRGAKIEDFRLHSGRSTLEATGELEGLVPYLTHGGKGVEKPHLQFELCSPFVDLDRMFPGDDSRVSTEAGPPVPIIDLVADGTVHFDSAVYFGVPLAGFTCKAHFADLVLTLADARGRVYGGEVAAELSVDYTDFDRPAFVIDVRADTIEANDFIDDFTGFGGHLFGKINLTGTFAGQGEEAGDIVRSLTARGAISMAEGRLEKLGLLSALGRQAGITGIRDAGPIKNMSADFWIADGRLYSKDWNFTSSGTHYNLAGSVGFDGSLDYRVCLTIPTQAGGNKLLSALGNLLGGAGGVTLDLALTGTYDQPRVKLDSGSNRKAFEKNLQAKARELFENLRRK